MSSTSGLLENLGLTTCVAQSGKYAARLGNGVHMFCSPLTGVEMTLLHAFVKKTQQTNPADIEMATNRFKEWKHGQSN